MNYIIDKIGKSAAWLSLVIVCLICFDVLFRYIFNSTKVWMIELEWYLFGVLFLFCGAWSWLEDRHVRVDVFYTRFSQQTKKMTNILGHLLLALPWIIVVLYASFKYANYSLKLGEGSPDPGGLPARYAIKFCIFFGFILMLMAVVSLLVSIFSKRVNR